MPEYPPSFRRGCFAPVAGLCPPLHAPELLCALRCQFEAMPTLERWRADDEAAQFLSVDVLAEPMLDLAFNAPVPSTVPLDGGGGATWRRAQGETRMRFSPDFVGEMGLERRIHQQTFLSPSMENARSGIARVWSVPVASLRGAAETQPRPKPNPNVLTVTPTPTPTLSLSLSPTLTPGPTVVTRSLELATTHSAEHARGRDQRERESTHDAALRAAQHEVQVSSLLPSAKPDIALKASTGSLLGLSQAASGDVLALGFDSVEKGQCCHGHRSKWDALCEDIVCRAECWRQHVPMGVYKRLRRRVGLAMAEIQHDQF